VRLELDSSKMYDAGSSCPNFCMAVCCMLYSCLDNIGSVMVELKECGHATLLVTRTVICKHKVCSRLI
jgi:hypothetical protein